MGYVADYDGSYYPQQQQPAYGYPAVGQQQQRQQPYRQQPTGARLKVMRCVQLKAPDSKRPLLDFGLGVGVDLDRQVRESDICACLQSTIFVAAMRR